MTRYAVRFAETAAQDAPRIARYLPSNYTCEAVGHAVVISGEDSHGWTMDDYVLPRLASGLWHAREVSAEFVEALHRGADAVAEYENRA